MRTALLYLAAVLQCAISYSATSVAALFVLAALSGIVQFRNIRPFVNGLSCLSACGVLSLLIMGGVRGLSSPLIEGVLGKTLTFTGQTYIWDSVLELMDVDHLVAGYGSSVRFNIVAEGVVSARLN